MARPRGKKTCPADGPALRARKAQSTDEAKKAKEALLGSLLAIG